DRSSHRRDRPGGRGRAPPGVDRAVHRSGGRRGGPADRPGRQGHPHPDVPAAARADRAAAGLPERAAGVAAGEVADLPGRERADVLRRGVRRRRAAHALLLQRLPALAAEGRLPGARPAVGDGEPRGGRRAVRGVRGGDRAQGHRHGPLHRGPLPAPARGHLRRPALRVHLLRVRRLGAGQRRRARRGGAERRGAGRLPGARRRGAAPDQPGLPARGLPGPLRHLDPLRAVDPLRHPRRGL
ncbi:MAG: hypothetical protein AVDCRST_MAG41-4525, partial [uncultured Corynebacteriales bacterium]